LPAALWAAGCSRPPARAADQRNALLISIDSLRDDHVGCYGYDKPTTPTLDAFARQNVRFAHAYAAAPWTLPSHASMFTGLYPTTHGVERSSRRLNEGAPTLARMLQAAGWQTGAIVCAPLLRAVYGLNQGFGTYDESLVGDSHKKARTAKVGPAVTDKALDWLDRADGRPFLLFLHYWDVHYDYTPPRRYEKMFDPDYRGKLDGADIRHRTDIAPGMNPRDLQHLLALYDAEIRYTDDAIADLLAGLTARGLDRNTMVWITADHGEEFLDHGGTMHGFTVYEDQLRVPLLARIPWLAATAKEIQEHVSLVDLLPTFLDLLNVPAGDRTLHGLSLRPLLTGGEWERDHILAETAIGRFGGSPAKARWSAMIDQAGGKLHRVRLNPKESRLMLFDLPTDPGEQRDQAETEVERRDALRRRLAHAQTAQRQLRATLDASAAAKIDPQMAETLKGLGYIR
jgi:arylsulfatase A-like enzyme